MCKGLHFIGLHSYSTFPSFPHSQVSVSVLLSMDTLAVCTRLKENKHFKVSLTFLFIASVVTAVYPCILAYLL